MKIKNCSSCGNNHKEVELRMMSNTEMPDGNVYDGYFFCPTTRRIVYVQNNNMGTYAHGHLTN
jgi:hypothetical protein